MAEFDWTAIGSSFATGLGGSLGKSGGPALSRADGNTSEAIFDNSGWNVNFDDGSIASDRQQLPALGGGLNTTVIVLGVMALIGLKLWAKRNK